LTGSSISLDGVSGFYIPTGHIDESGQLSEDYVVDKLKPFFESDGKKLYMANSKYDMEVFRIVDSSINFSEKNAFCTMTASFILNVDNEHGLKESIMREFGHKMLTLDAIGCPKIKDKLTKDNIYFTDRMSIENLAPYAIDDAVQTYRLGELYTEKIASEGFTKIFYELEMPFMFVLMELEEQGVLLDKKSLVNFMEDAPKKLEAMNQEIQEILPSDEEVNLLSNPQMNDILFKRMKIKPRGNPLKSGGYSVSNAYLDLWSVDHKVCGMIADYRRTSKLFGNYLSNLHNRLGADGRIRSSFNRHVASTGRLSSSKPNLQNIPRAENDRYGLRKLFIASEGKSLIVADYSQIELRVVAHLSQDPIMIEAFQRGDDIHSITAKEIFKLDCDVGEIKKKYPIKRQIAKAVNFGIIYEGGAKTLAATANKEIEDQKDWVTEEEMEVIIENYFKRYKGIKRHINVCHQKAMKNGYIKTITGRKRPLPDAQIKAVDRDTHRIRYGAFRKSSNTPVQGSAADIIAIAMRNIRERLKEKNLYNNIFFELQVHDELLFEVDSHLDEKCAKIIKEEMESSVHLKVPLVADVSIGKVWGDMK
jgi:DNA polymerase I